MTRTETSTEEEIYNLEAMAERLLRAHDETPYLTHQESFETRFTIDNVRFLMAQWFKNRGVNGEVQFTGGFPRLVIHAGLPSNRELDRRRAFAL